MLSEYFKTTKDLNLLYRLNDRELSDIGLSRCDIYCMNAQNSFWSALFDSIKVLALKLRGSKNA